MKLVRWALAVVRLGDRRAEVESDFNELFQMRSQARGRGYAVRRLIVDVISVTRSPRRGSVGQDFRFGLRLIRKHPAPIGITVAGLALAIGVVTAAFGLINSALLRPFNMDDPSTAVSISRQGPRASSAWPYAQFLHWKQGLRLTATEASLLDQTRFSAAAGNDEAASGYTRFVSGGYFSLFGGRVRTGRGIEPSDDASGAPLVAVVSHAFWTSNMNADVSVVGRTVWLGDSPVTIVGVMDPGFEGPVRMVTPQFWAPLSAYDEITHSREFTPTSNALVDVFGRRAPGVSIGAAQNELTAMSSGLVNWQGAPDQAARAARVVSASSPWDGQDLENRIGAFSALGIAGLVLMLACANAANLLLAGAASRMREMGVRLALGATRGRLIRQLVSESVLLGLMSGALGFLLSAWLMKAGAMLASLPDELLAPPDLRVLLFAIGVAVLSGIGAGLSPARYGTRGDVLSALKMQHGQPAPASHRSKLRVSFVGVQAAVSIFFLVAAGLLTRSALTISHTSLGFDADKLLSIRLDIPRTPANYDEGAQVYNDNARAYLAAALARVRALPSVEAAALAMHPPYGFSRMTTRAFSHDGRSYNVFGNESDASYFRTAGFRVTRGRAFTDEEAASGAPVALISESVARDFFGPTDPIGQSLTGVRTPMGNDSGKTVIGVVADAMTFRPDTERYGNIYTPIGRRFNNPPTLIVRATDPAKIARQVEAALLSLNAAIRPQSQLIGAAVARSSANQRAIAIMAACVAVLAFVLALLGVYGVTAFTLSQRTQEIGVRLTFGATAGEIFSLLVRQSLRPVAIGLIVGLSAAMAVFQVLSSMIGGIGPRDPIALGLAGTLLFGGALLAVVGPARLAASADPASVLRQS
jgi:predicted permease